MSETDYWMITCQNNNQTRRTSKCEVDKNRIEIHEQLNEEIRNTEKKETYHWSWHTSLTFFTWKITAYWKNLFWISFRYISLLFLFTLPHFPTLSVSTALKLGNYSYSIGHFDWNLEVTKQDDNKKTKNEGRGVKSCFK